HVETFTQTAVLVRAAPELPLEHLPPATQIAAAPGGGLEETPNESLHYQRDITERNVIQGALMSNGYSRTRAADSLGISRVTLYKKMKKYGLMNAAGAPARV